MAQFKSQVSGAMSEIGSFLRDGLQPVPMDALIAPAR
jgi:hypothetical protein